jgi:hypothetical protein
MRSAFDTAAKNGDFRRSNDEGIEKHTQTQRDQVLFDGH